VKKHSQREKIPPRVEIPGEFDQFSCARSGQSAAARELFFLEARLFSNRMCRLHRRKKIALTLPNKIDCFVTRTDIF
jgi:hypothetical protein